MFGGVSPQGPTGKKTTGDIVHLPIGDLHPYSKQSTFKPYSEQKMNELVASIKEHGVLSPVLVRPCNSGYEIIAGHNRIAASKLAEKSAVPAIVRDDLDDEAADILFVETNFAQREEICTSERAKGYRLKHDAMKRQGKRTDLSESELSGRSAHILGQEDRISANSVFRYIRLSYLSDGLLEIADEGRISIRSGTELSYIERADTQNTLSAYLQEHKKARVTEDQAKRLRQLADESDLSLDQIAAILSPPKREKKKALSKAVKVPVKRLRDAFTDAEYADLDDNKLVEMLLAAFLQQRNHSGSEVLNE